MTLHMEYFRFATQNRGKSVTYLAEEFLKLILELNVPIPQPYRVRVEVLQSTNRLTTVYDKVSPSYLEAILSRLYNGDIKYQRADWKRAVRTAKVKLAAQALAESRINQAA